MRKPSFVQRFSVDTMRHHPMPKIEEPMDTGSSFLCRGQLTAILIAGSLLVCSLILSTAALAQTRDTASLAGTVRDSSGAAVVEAQVILTQSENGVTQNTQSGANGAFVFPVLPVGPYRLTIKKEGFEAYQQTGIVLTVSQAAQLPVTLVPGKIEQIVTVQANAPTVDTTTGTVSLLFDERQIVALPLNGRNPAELVLLTAGVTNPVMNSTIAPVYMGTFQYPTGIGSASQNQGAQVPVINGLRPGGVYYSLDGANNLDPVGVIGGPFPNPDAVQEFRVVTSGYGAEYVSAAGGSVNIITKSGTNQFHGGAFEFLRNGHLNGRNYFAAKQDNVRRNQFGGQAGGPILQNKLFVFGSYQKTILRSSTGGDIQFVPTEAERAGDFSAIPIPLKNPFTQQLYPSNQIPLSDFNPVTQQILALLPHSSDPTGRIEVVHPTAQDEDQGTMKVDYLRGRHSFVARYFVTDFRSAGADNSQNLLLSAGPQQFRWQDLMLGHDFTSGHLVNDFRFTYQRSTGDVFTGLPKSWKQLGAAVTESAHPFIEFMQVQGAFTIGGGSFNGFPRDSFTFSDHLSIVRGKHQLSLGSEVTRIRSTEFTDHLQSGIAVWAQLPPQLPFTSGNPMADFLLGKPTIFGQGDGLLAHALGTLWGFYGQDQIRATPRLNLTLGLRWDPYWPFHNLHGRALCFRPGQRSTVFVNAPQGLLYPGDPGCDGTGGVQPDLHTIQPRFGFAYRLDQKGNTAVRGGYGIYTTQFPMQSFLPFASEPPYIRTIISMFPASISNPWATFPGGDPFASGFRADDLPRPSNIAFPPNLSASGLAPDFKLGNLQKWNLSLDHSFGGNTLVQGTYVGTKGTHLSFNEEANPAIFIPGICGGSPCSTPQNTQSRRVFQNIGSVQITESGTNSSYQALQVVLQRRMQKGLTVSAQYTWSKNIDYVSQNANGEFVGAFDEVADPFNPKFNRGLSDFDLSHAFSATFVWQPPSFNSENFFFKHILSGWQVSGIWSWQVGEPFSVYSGIDNSLTGVGQDLADRVPGVPPFLSPDRPREQLVQEYYNPGAFQQNALGTFGNSGRNTLRGPGYNNVDFSLMRNFRFRESYNLILRGEAFNLTNTPHFAAPGQGGPGQIAVGNPLATQIFKARDPRIVQVALKLNW